MENIKKYLSINKIGKYWSIIFVGMIFAFFGLYILLNENNVIIPMHDNLDIYIDVYKVLKDNNLFFKHNVIAPFLGGIDRDFLPSELKIYSLCYALFRPYVAYHLAYLFRILLSIIGFIFCNKYIVKGKNINLAILIGFIYALLPYYPHQAIGFASLPLLFAVCYSSFVKLDLKKIIVLLCSGFAFDFVFHGIFICGYILFFFIVLSIINKRIHFNSLITLIIIIISFLIEEYRLFGLLLLKKIPLHRIEQVGTYSKSIKNLYMSFNEVFRFGHYHSGDIHYLIIYLIVIFAVAYILVDIVVRNNKNFIDVVKKIFTNPLIITLLFILFNCFIYALDSNFYFKQIVSALFKSLRGFQFARTLWFNPLLWYFALFYILSKILQFDLNGIDNIKNASIFLFSIYLVTRLFIYPNSYNEIQCNLFKNQNNLTFCEYYSESLFNKIKKDINYNKNDKCLCLGMHPSIAIYNGFYCLDGYFNIMPLSIKHNFRKIIAPSLDAEGSKYKKYFDDWGNRVYTFCDDVGYAPVKIIDETPVELRINSIEFKNAGGKYIVSRVPIKNTEYLKLNFVKKYSDETSPYNIYLYEN